MVCRYPASLLSLIFFTAIGLVTAQNAPTVKIPAQATTGEWRSLFDGQTLDGWKETPFVARGKVSIEQGTIVLGTGYMTGITWTRDFPKANYEVRYEASRIQGGDFFGAITFPVYDSFCTWVSGGWGGMLVGLSSIDLMDASENETATMIPFKQGQWYSFRLRVTDYTIEAWIDEEQVIFVDIYGREVGLRPGEIERSIPLGFSSYSTVGALRRIEYRLLPPAKEDYWTSPFVVTACPGAQTCRSQSFRFCHCLRDCGRNALVPRGSIAEHPRKPREHGCPG